MDGLHLSRERLQLAIPLGQRFHLRSVRRVADFTRQFQRGSAVVAQSAILSEKVISTHKRPANYNTALGRHFF